MTVPTPEDPSLNTWTTSPAFTVIARPTGSPLVIEVPVLAPDPRIPAPSIVAVYDSPVVVAAAAFLRVTLMVAAAARDETAT